MKVYSYVVARDYGFAPNPFFRVCSLATCKPRIRAAAKLGDLVVGISPHREGRRPKLVYVMRVTGSKTFDEYWSSPDFIQKKPNLCGSKMQAFGDNIYNRDAQTGKWRQLNSHHSWADGSENSANTENDTQADRVLLSEDYVYWGGDGPAIPPRFEDFGSAHETLVVRRNHRSNFSAEFVASFNRYFSTLNERGCIGKPADWIRSP